MPGALTNDNLKATLSPVKIAKPEAEKTFAEKFWTPGIQHDAAIGAAILVTVVLAWLLWRRRWPQKLASAVPPYWRESVLFALLCLILLRIW